GPDQRAIDDASRQLLTERIDQADLTDLEREVIKLRCGLSVDYYCSYEELAQRLDITPARVKERERKAIEKIRSGHSSADPMERERIGSTIVEPQDPHRMNEIRDAE